MKEKEITIYDLASKLNISAATVSRGLKNHPSIKQATRQKIFDLAGELGYRTNHHASNLRNQQTKTIGVIVPRLNSNFMSTVIAGIEHIANNQGYNLIISQSLEMFKKEVLNAKTMFDNRVDGLLVSLAYDTENIDHFEPFFNKKIPLLFFDRVAQHKDCTNVVIDNKNAAFLVTDHLIRQGCKRIVHITASSSSNVYTDRLAGYKAALAHHKIAYKSELVIYNNLSNAGGAEAAEKIMQMKTKPDAVFAANDSCAVGCMQVLKKGGYNIPGDIAFAGFNNDPVSTVIEPNLTTIDYHGYQMGETAAQYLINHLKGVANISTTNQIIGQHVGTIGMSAVIILRARLPFAVGLH